MTALKTQKNNASVTAFLHSVEDPQRRADAKQLLALFKEVTGLKPVMWGTSLVGFGMYHYKSDRSRQEGDWPLTAFSPRKTNLTVYIMPGFKGYETLLKKLGKYKLGKSCLYLTRLSDVDVPTLKQIIAKGFKDAQRLFKAPMGK